MHIKSILSHIYCQMAAFCHCLLMTESMWKIEDWYVFPIKSQSTTTLRNDCMIDQSLTWKATILYVKTP